MTREPDRFDVIGEELACAYHTVRCPDRSTLARQIAAALRQAADEALERAAQEAEALSSNYDKERAEIADGIAEAIRYLASPAAAAAAETERFFPGAAELMGEPPSGPVAPAPYTAPVTSREPEPSLLPRVLAALDSVAARTPNLTWHDLAAELRRYIAEHDDLLRECEAWMRGRLRHMGTGTVERISCETILAKLQVSTAARSEGET